MSKRRWAMVLVGAYALGVGDGRWWERRARKKRDAAWMTDWNARTKGWW